MDRDLFFNNKLETITNSSATFLHEVMDHTKKTWNHVLHGKAETNEYLDAGVEAVVIGAAVAALGKLSLSRVLGKSALDSASEEALGVGESSLKSSTNGDGFLSRRHLFVSHEEANLKSLESLKPLRPTTAHPAYTGWFDTSRLPYKGPGPFEWPCSEMFTDSPPSNLSVPKYVSRTVSLCLPEEPTLKPSTTTAFTSAHSPALRMPADISQDGIPPGAATELWAEMSIGQGKEIRIRYVQQ